MSQLKSWVWSTMLSKDVMTELVRLPASWQWRNDPTPTQKHRPRFIYGTGHLLFEIFTNLLWLEPGLLVWWRPSTELDRNQQWNYYENTSGVLRFPRSQSGRSIFMSDIERRIKLTNILISDEQLLYKLTCDEVVCDTKNTTPHNGIRFLDSKSQ